MTSKFKVGDRVQMIASSYWTKLSPEFPILTGRVIAIASQIAVQVDTKFYQPALCGCSKGWPDVTWLVPKGKGGWWYAEQLQLLNSDPFQDHIDALIKAGYTIIPPAPKLQGQIVILKYKDQDTPLFANGDRFKDWSNKADFTLIARLNWVEGQGLD